MLGHFVTFCWANGWDRSRRGNQFATIQAKIASIKWFHRQYLGIVLKTSPRFHLLLQGVKRLSEVTKKKQPITPAFLRLLRRTLNFRHPRQRLLWGSVLLGYFFLLRRSEYLRIESVRHFYCLKSTNAFFDSRGNPVRYLRHASSVTIGLEGAKNDQYGRGAWRTMHESGDRLLCSVRAMRHIRRAREELGCKSSEYLCADLDAKAVPNALKTTANSISVPASSYSTHSIRIGGATSLMAGGADSLSIKLLGRWMSHCYEEYPLQSATATLNLSQRMV